MTNMKARWTTGQELKLIEASIREPGMKFGQRKAEKLTRIHTVHHNIAAVNRENVKR